MHYAGNGLQSACLKVPGNVIVPSDPVLQRHKVVYVMLRSIDASTIHRHGFCGGAVGVGNSLPSVLLDMSAGLSASWMCRARSFSLRFLPVIPFVQRQHTFFLCLRSDLSILIINER